jgi:hypothetical protein
MICKFCLCCSENLDLSSLVVSHLGLPADKIMVTQAKLTKLIMYQAGGRYERNLNNSEKEFGIIMAEKTSNAHNF